MCVYKNDKVGDPVMEHGSWCVTCIQGRRRRRSAALLYDQDQKIIYGICTSFYETFQHQAVYLYNLGLPENSICDRSVKREKGVRVYYF